MTTVSAAASPGSERLWVGRHVRRLAAAGCAAALVGALVGGVGGRLAMRLLAAINPGTTAMVTDDGFVVGQISLGGSLQLVAAAIQFAMLGAFVYLIIRPLLMGPTWLRVITVAVGAGGTLGAILVQPGHLDFQVFQPRLLAAALFVGLPMLHVACFALLAERWMAEDSWFARAPLRSVLLTLPVWLLGVFVVPLVAVSALALLIAHRRPLGAMTRAGVLWAGRVVLVAIFVVAVLDLSGDLAALT